MFLKAKNLNKPLLATKIFLSRDVHFIKAAGSELGTSEDWEQRQFDIMYECVKRKFEQKKGSQNPTHEDRRPPASGGHTGPAVGMWLHTLIQRTSTPRLAWAKQTWRDTDDRQGRIPTHGSQRTNALSDASALGMTLLIT